MPVTAPYHQFFCKLRKCVPNMERVSFYAFSYSQFRRIVEGGLEGIHPEAGAVFVELFPQSGERLLQSGVVKQSV